MVRVGLLLVIVVLLGTGGIPYLTALGNEDAQHVFSGYLHYPEDMDSYAMWVNQSASGAWLFSNRYDSSRPAPAYFNPLWLISGKLRSLFGLSFGAILQLLRLFGGAMLLLVFWRLLGEFKVPDSQRLAGLCLFAFGGGLGWLYHPLSLAAPPPDLYTELFPFVQVTLVPHVAVSHALFLAAMAMVLRAEREKSPAWSLSAGGLLFLLGSFRVYDLVVGCCTAALFLLPGLFTGDHRVKKLTRAAAVLLPPVPILFYAWWLSTKAPGFSIWSETNIYPPPPVHSLLLGVGLVSFGAAGWFATVIRRPLRMSKPDSLVLAWLLAAWFLMYSGLIPWPVRILGVFATPAVLAATLMIARLSLRTGWRVAIWAVVIAATLPTSAMIMAQKTREAAGQNRYYFQPPRVLEALDWLNDARPGALVLTHGHIGLKVPARTRAYSLLGHKDLTPDWAAKLRTYRRFIHAGTPEEAMGVLDRFKVDILFWGPLDRRFATFDPAGLADLAPVYSNGLVTMYGRK